MNFLSDLAFAHFHQTNKPPLVLNPGPHDVIVVGRRAVRHEGNNHFYRLVESRRGRLRDSICEILATEVIENIAACNGRFLRGINSLLLDSGGVGWLELDFAGALDVVIQAFQEEGDDSHSSTSPPAKRAKVTPSPSECSSPGHLSTQCAELEDAFARGKNAQNTEEALLASIRELQMKRDLLKCMTTSERYVGTSLGGRVLEEILQTTSGFRPTSSATLSGRQELLASLISRSERSRRELEGSREKLWRSHANIQDHGSQPSPVPRPQLKIQPLDNQSLSCSISSSIARSPKSGDESESPDSPLQVQSPRRSSVSAPAMLETFANPKAPMSRCLQWARTVASKTTSGHFAICWAQLLHTTGIQEETNNVHISMSLIETHILKVLCSHGLPVWSPRGALEVSGIDTMEDDGELDEMGFSWADFANLLIQAAMEWRERSRPGETSAEHSEVEGKAVDIATTFSRNTRNLAMITVALFEKVRRCSGRFGDSLFSDSEKLNSKRTRKDVRDSVTRWLSGELARWAASIDISDPDTQMAIPYCSGDYLFASSGRCDNMMVKPVALFDKDAFDVIYSQVACISRLRSVCAKNEVIRLLMDQNEDDAANGLSRIQVWSKGPSWWVDEQRSCCNQDAMLLQNLLQEGYLGILMCHVSIEHSVSDDEDVKSGSYHELGMSYRALQERIEQLAILLHFRAAGLQMKTLKENLNMYLQQSGPRENSDTPAIESV